MIRLPAPLFTYVFKVIICMFFTAIFGVWVPLGIFGYVLYLAYKVVNPENLQSFIINLAELTFWALGLVACCFTWMIF